jgi:hypothetical protein
MNLGKIKLKLKLNNCWKLKGNPSSTNYNFKISKWLGITKREKQSRTKGCKWLMKAMWKNIIIYKTFESKCTKNSTNEEKKIEIEIKIVVLKQPKDKCTSLCVKLEDKK